MSNKIDAMVAEKVMGWEWNTNGWCRKGYKPQPHDVPVKPFSPSVDIDAAWMVWSNQHVRNHVEGVYPQLRDDLTILHWVCPVRINASRFGCVQDTAPLALCLAALRAVGVDEATIQEAMK